MLIDLRSDTVTKPSAAMRSAMARAEVGDDTFQEDPTVKRLEERTACLLGVEAALFVPSGTMANQIALRIAGRPGDNVICHRYSHIFEYETGGPAANCGLTGRLIDTPDGTFTPTDMASEFSADDIHKSRDRVVALENTHNRCGGVIWAKEQYDNVCRCAHDRGLFVHLDGARLWNACVASGIWAGDWTRHVDSVTVCFSKGLGAPIGSAICGSEEIVKEARFYRKMLGGQMRQVGILAAAGLYALENNIDRLEEDHHNAQLLAEMISDCPGVSCGWPETNILMIDVTDNSILAQDIVAQLADEGVACFSLTERSIRLVTHMDVTTEDCRKAGVAFQKTMEKMAGQTRLFN